MRRAALLALLAVAVLSPGPAAAQCAMCKAALTNSPEGQAMVEEFNKAILLMIFAPYAVFGTVGAVLLRKRIRAALERARARWRGLEPAASDPFPDDIRLH